jgi:hypothetical protein
LQGQLLRQCQAVLLVAECLEVRRLLLVECLEVRLRRKDHYEN